jgi:hypothetical protein
MVPTCASFTVYPGNGLRLLRGYRLLRTCPCDAAAWLNARRDQWIVGIAPHELGGPAKAPSSGSYAFEPSRAERR